MAIAHVQSKGATNDADATSIAATFDSNVSAGNLLVVAGQFGDAPSVSDTLGNSYQLAVENGGTRIFYCANCLGGANTVTVQFDSATYNRISIHEFSGAAKSDVLDVTANSGIVDPGSSATDGDSSGPATTTVDGALIFGCIMDIPSAWSIAAGTGFTERYDNNIDYEAESKVQATAGSVAATWTASNTDGYRAVMAAFKPQPLPAYFGSASNPTDNSALDGSAARVVIPVSNMQAGDLCFMLAQVRNSTATLSVFETGGQSWNTLAQFNATNVRGRLFWCTFNGSWSANPSVTGGSAGVSMTVVMHAFRPPTTSYTWAVDVVQVTGTFTAGSSPFTKTINGITSLTDGAIVFASWASVDDNTWGSLTSGWSTPGTSQYRNTQSSSNQSITSAYKIMATAGASGNVAKNQATLGGDAGATSIVAFKAVLSTPVSLADSGSGADGISVGTTLAVSDSGSGSDAIALAGSLNLLDAGGGVDAQSIAAALALADSGSGADILVFAQTVAIAISDGGTGEDALAAINAAVSLVDSGSGQDVVAALAAALSLADSGSGADAIAALQAAVAISDAGAGAEVLSLIGNALISDVGSGNDVISTILANLSLFDSGAGSDILSLVNAVLLSDSGTGLDALTVLAVVLVALEDGGVGVDEVAILIASLSLSDSGAGAESMKQVASLQLADAGTGGDVLALAAAIPIGDSGVGVDAITLAANLFLDDSGDGTDSVLVYVPLSIADAGSGLDDLTIGGQVSLSDFGTGVDLFELLGQIAIADAASGTDTLIAVIEGAEAAVSLADAGLGEDSLSVVAYQSLSDLGAAIDELLLEGHIVIVDSGIGTEGMVRVARGTASQAYEAISRKRGYEATARRRGFESSSREQAFEASSRERNFKATTRKRNYDA